MVKEKLKIYRHDNLTKSRAVLLKNNVENIRNFKITALFRECNIKNIMGAGTDWNSERNEGNKWH